MPSLGGFVRRSIVRERQGRGAGKKKGDGKPGIKPPPPIPLFREGQ